MNYQAYGLPSTSQRQGRNRKGKPGTKICLFCGHHIQQEHEIAINACFAHFCFCRSCLITAAGPVGSQHQLKQSDPNAEWECYTCFFPQQEKTYPESPIWRWYGYNPLLEKEVYSLYGMCQAHAQEHLTILEKMTGKGPYQILPSGEAKYPISLPIYQSQNKYFALLLAEDNDLWAIGTELKIGKDISIRLRAFNPTSPTYSSQEKAIQAHSRELLNSPILSTTETKAIRKALIQYLSPQKRLF